MNEAAFELLEALTRSVRQRLQREQEHAPDFDLRRELLEQSIELGDLLDKARHEQKGGPR